VAGNGDGSGHDATMRSAHMSRIETAPSCRGPRVQEVPQLRQASNSGPAISREQCGGDRKPSLGRGPGGGRLSHVALPATELQPRQQKKSQTSATSHRREAPKQKLTRPSMGLMIKRSVCVAPADELQHRPQHTARKQQTHGLKKHQRCICCRSGSCMETPPPEKQGAHPQAVDMPSKHGLD